MTILFDAVLGVIEKKIVLPHYGKSTATGTTTTLIDTSHVTQDGYFNEGTLLLRTGTYANTYHRVTGYLATLGQFTISAAVAGNIPSGEDYVATELLLSDIIGAINVALREIGMVLAEDVTTVVVPGQAEYSLPANVSDVRKVEDIIQGFATEKNRWEEVAGKLRFYSGFEAVGDNLRITYKQKPVYITLASAAISPYVDLNWLCIKAALHLVDQLKVVTGDTNKYDEVVKKLMEEEMMFRNPTPDMPIVKLARW